MICRAVKHKVMFIFCCLGAQTDDMSMVETANGEDEEEEESYKLGNY